MSAVHAAPSASSASRVATLRVGVLVVAYNAADTLVRTIERIPPAVMDRLEEVFVFDDHSTDDTYRRLCDSLSTRPMPKVRIFRNERNLRYGGNQKRGYRYAIERGLDLVVLLHGDGQYSPEVMDELIEPFEHPDVGMVMGSRMLPGGDPLGGGMPLYKFVGNRVLTRLENWILGTRLSEFHSGYRVYSCHALRQVPFTACSDDWHFDTEIIIQLLARRFHLVERPIPTYYGDEICYVNGMSYAYHCLASVVAYRLSRWGWRAAPKFNV